MEFARIIQAKTDADGGEVTPAEIWSTFQEEYLSTEDQSWSRLGLNSYRDASIASSDIDSLAVDVFLDGQERTLEGTGNGPIAAFVDAVSRVGIDVQVLDYSEHALSSGRDALAASYVECSVDGRMLWGVGLDTNIVRASMRAVVSAVNRAARP
jgi:2-isopropylmalate synthase